ncbi:hypothetical protein MBLNU13_g03365t1 [Cladosporium sp. NU13]
MAEVVGLVIGVVSLGVQLAESVQKVKRFYNTVKDAPERLTDIIDEIESLSDILTEMEGDRTSYTAELGPKMQRCVATCRQAVDKFSTYADSLESRMKRHSRRGSVKFAMKSESIEGVISRLESSKSNLVLAYMLYREAVAEKRTIQMQQQMETMAVTQTLLLHQPLLAPATPNTSSNNSRLTPVLHGKNVTSVIFYKPGVARFLITTTGNLLEITAFDVKHSWRTWSVWASPKLDLKALKGHFSLLLEYCDSDGLDSSLDEVRTFAYGSDEDANIVLFWNEIIHVSQHRSATEREMIWLMLLDAVVLDDEIEYLFGDRAIDYLYREGIEPSSAAHLLTMAFIASAVSSSYHGMSNARVLGKLIAEARHIGIDPLDCEDTAISPMLRLLHPEPSNSALATNKGWKDLSEILDAWVCLLDYLGVDLAAYGEKEWRVFQHVRRKYEFKRDNPYDPTADDLDCRPTLFSFSYGAAVSDWELWEVHPGDQYAGHFWAMIEQIGLPSEGDCVQEMPGGWLDD